ncbi:lipopolysaccharide biosynthesis protein [Enterovirga sp. DB1703]|uniref:Lipopolysaccharide biosynthesis protein n=1 Tax=Enterovirga aerilata TaxID=2730920 RepID=A0A849IEH2_9HYPH|nr:lipopolysaccharide biosynthesis protein [Enterovirga sp. DB1703]
MLRSMRTHWRYIAIPTILVFIAATIFVNVVSPRYTGEAKLILQTADSYYTRPGQDRGADQTQLIDEQAVASQVQVVMSRDIAREAIRRLELVGNPEFDPGVRDVGLLRGLMMMLGLAKDPSVRAPEDRVLEKYYDALLVYPVGKSRIVSIEFRSKDPDLAAKAANTIAELYLAQQEDAKKDLARSASTWLGQNIDALRTRVADAEAKVEAFRARTGLLMGSGTNTLSAQQLSELSAQLAQARTAQSDAQAKAQLVRDLIRDGRAFEIPDVANNELIRRLIEQRINLRAQLALELRTLMPQHPRIKELNAQLQDLEGQIRGAAERTARTLENDSRIAGGRVQALQAAIDEQKQVVVQANENEVQLRALEREARTQREQLESYLTRYREATARDAENAAPPDARIVSRAVVPQNPSFPKKLPIVAITTFATLMLSAGAIVARELLGSGAPRPMVPVPAPAPAGAPVGPAGSGPLDRPGTSDIRPEPLRPGTPDAAPARAEALPPPPLRGSRYDFGNLIERLERIKVEDRARRLLVTGVDRGPEAVDVGRGLALTLAGIGRTILVEIDPDEQVSAEKGFTDLVAGEVSFADVIGREPGSKLHRIPVGTLKYDTVAAEPEALDVTLSALEKTYDWVVCVFRVNVRTDLVRLFAPRVDAVVIASNLEPASQDLVRTYEEAREAGASDVMVAREQAVPEMGEEAA